MTAPLDSGQHLTEAERQGAADGSLPEPRRRRVAEHLAACPACDADVARLGRVVTLARASGPLTAPLDALWPDIRARIERDKVVALVPPTPAPRRAPRWRWASGIGAAGLAAAAGLAMVLRANRPAPIDGSAPAGSSGDAAFVSAETDSSRAYEQQVQALLDEMALRRAMLRPDVAARMDHDVRVIDAAIAELQDALRHDPNNAALRQLLAASYRQKRDLLKRVANAS